MHVCARARGLILCRRESIVYAWIGLRVGGEGRGDARTRGCACGCVVCGWCVDGCGKEFVTVRLLLQYAKGMSLAASLLFECALRSSCHGLSVCM